MTPSLSSRSDLECDRKDQLQEHVNRVGVYLEKRKHVVYPSQQIADVTRRKWELQVLDTLPAKQALKNGYEELVIDGELADNTLKRLDNDDLEREVWTDYIRSGSATSVSVDGVSARAQEWVENLKEEFKAMGEPLGEQSDCAVSLMMRGFDLKIKEEEDAFTIVRSLLTHGAEAQSVYEKRLRDTRAWAQRMLEDHKQSYEGSALRNSCLGSTAP